MDYRKLVKDLVFTAILVFLLYFDISNWHNRTVGLILVLFYFFFISSGIQVALSNFFGLSGHAFRIKILGILLSLTTLSLILEFEIIFLRLTASAIAIAFFLNAAVFLVVDLLTHKNDVQPEIDNENLSVVEELPQSKIGLLLYVILVLFAFYLLYSSRTGTAIVTPWQTINPKLIYTFFFATLILGFLVFSKLKAKSILFLLVVNALLLFSYLPLTHQLIYGADGWRHIATESRLLQEKPLDLVVYGEQNFLNKLNLGQFSYGQVWGISVVFARILNLPLLTVNAWLNPIAWAIFLPILLFEIAMALSFTKKQSLFFAWLGLLPFAVQASGAFTLPATWGLLAWLLFSLLILKRLVARSRGQVIFLSLLGVSIFFGYALYSILMILEWIIAEILLSHKYDKFKLKKVFAVLVVGLALPVIELIVGYSKFTKLDWFGQVKQFIGNLTSFYLASGPRPHDISTGNIIFNQTPSYAFFSNILTQWRWWLVIFMLLFLTGAVYGLISFWKSEKIEKNWLAIISSGLFISYFICLYLLGGDHLISRRLDAVVAICLLILFFEAWIKLILNKMPQTLAIIFSVIIFSLTIAASYSLGPDTYTVSSDQYKAIDRVWQFEQNSNKFCVVADTYPLLALEAISGKEIIGGGFPIDQNFSQPERVDIFNRMQKGITNDMLNKSFAATGADHCWFLLANNELLRYNLK